jgi:hypothetical protein
MNDKSQNDLTSPEKSFDLKEKKIKNSRDTSF